MCCSILMVSCTTEKKEVTEEPKVPTAEKVVKELSGNRVDNYYWMKLSDEQKNAAQKDEQTQKVINYSSNSYSQ